MASFQEYPCPNCGGQLRYDPDASALKCVYCKSQVPVMGGAEKVVEAEIQSFLQLPLLKKGIVGKVQYRCPRCGSESQWPENDPAFKCKHCGNDVVNTDAYTLFPVQPTGIVPFLISKDEATTAFQNWIKSGFWYKSALPVESVLNQLVGYYLPFWTFDAKTSTDWQGYGGRIRYETVSVRNAQGVSESRTQQRIDWEFRSGHMDEFYDDILICGSGKISQSASAAVFPYRMDQVKNFDPRFIVGWESEVADINARQCYDLYQKTVKEMITAKCAAACTINTYRDLRVNAQFTEETYKHLLLPIWICNYVFKGKTYFFHLNGQTGKISGTRPLSAGKISIAVIIAIIILALIYMASQGGS